LDFGGFTGTEYDEAGIGESYLGEEFFGLQGFTVGEF
jgi:hypothetical protein